eukprot:CAMPEP_0194171750 /NCGR_PEP_ID=MMETSP0154-20130528/6300_1 /TAXON_ID=1049557 /ORGANISM="Thalassiothrix antarctica, Strain L6-D1" /LENGTH=251 /DNA_ID=CAMNT_0038884169 /DNA_START=18 /DNA_END=773 /DNA_ORIENTATION=+
MAASENKVLLDNNNDAFALKIKNEPIYFEQSWDTGIGGGLWSTGLAMGKYLESQHLETNLQRTFYTRKEKLNVLELGSGNGFLAVCLLAYLKDRIENLVVTDLDDDHLALMKQTMNSNHHLPNHDRVTLMEHKWGHFVPTATTESNNNDSSIIKAQVQSGTVCFDLIIGSDVAYHPDLYDVLIQSLCRFSTSKTIILLGVTMVDTRPMFFHKLCENGFCYERYADHLLHPNFRGSTFGIFVVQKKNKEDRF